MQLRKESLKKKLGLYGIRTLDLSDTCAAIWKQVVELVRYKPGPWKDDDDVMNNMKIVHENCGVKNTMKENHCII